MKVEFKVAGLRRVGDDLQGRPQIAVRMEDKWDSQNAMEITILGSKAKPYAQIGRNVLVEIKPA